MKAGGMSLLEMLANEMHCRYISDLKCGFMNRAYLMTLESYIEEIPLGKYPLSEWNDCVQYITSYNGFFDTEVQARQYIKKYAE